MLGVNYRCSANIVKAAGNLIAHNQNRLPKDILAAHEAGAEVKNLCYEKSADKMKRYGSRFWSIVKREFCTGKWRTVSNQSQARGLTVKLWSITFLLN